MNFTEILKVSAAIISTLGGGSLIVFALSSYLGKIWANRLMEKEKANYARDLESLKNTLLLEAESHKVRLKKSEFLFEKEFEATSSFSKIYMNFTPSVYHPDMDMEDAVSIVARSFSEIEQALDDYISNFSPVLPDEIKDNIWQVNNLAAKNKFLTNQPELPHEALDAAQEAYNLMAQIEKDLITQLKSQITT